MANNGIRSWHNQDGILQTGIRPSAIFGDGKRVWVNDNGGYHRDCGPAVVAGDHYRWCLDGVDYTFDEWIDKMAETMPNHAADMKALWADVG